MKTYLLGTEEVSKYALDFAERMNKLDPNDFPSVWYPIGISGQKMADEILNHIDEALLLKIRIVNIFYDRTSSQINFASNDEENVNGSVLLIDSAVHSGLSMFHAARALLDRKHDEIISYSLVLKSCSMFIPNYFGIVIEKEDRAFFQLAKYPNNRIRRKGPFAIVRRIMDEDALAPIQKITSGVDSIDKMTLADFLYEFKAKSADVFISELKGKYAGILVLHKKPYGVLFLDLVAIDTTTELTKGLGGDLIRWAETYARIENLNKIRLWSINNQIDTYKKYGFEILHDTMQLGHNESYTLMEKSLIHHFKITDGEINLDASSHT